MNTRMWQIMALMVILATMTLVAEATSEPAPGTTRVREADRMVMVYVPAGEFLMGSPIGEGRYNEWPQHTVYLDGFWIDRTEMTNRQFEMFVQATGYRTEAEEEGRGGLFAGDYPVSQTAEGADWRHPEGPDSSIAERLDEPVAQVSWNDAQAYCQWAGARLPTEAQWEKAARGTDGRRYPWGNQEPSCQYAVMADDRGESCGHGRKPWPVGSKPAGASPYGALDMVGNVWEVVADWYGEHYYSDSPASNPQGPASGYHIVWRGGSFVRKDVYSDFLRCAFRGRDPKTLRGNPGGFRCAVSASTLAVTPVSSTPTLAVSLDSALVTKIEAAIEQTMKMNQIPGLAIGIIKDGQVVYRKGFGLAQVGTDRAVTPETVFQLASESKMMIGTAMMQLKDQGKIDLDAPVTTYLPYFQLADERYTAITIRQVLSHRSGLRYSTGYGYHSYASDYRSPQYDEGALERHVRNLTQVTLKNPPGKRMQYSDLGFEILGDVIAKVSGQSFEEYTQEHIFTPLGMTHTTFLVREVPPALLAAPHEFGNVNSFFPYSRQHAPSSHLFSNVDDMSRFAMAHFNQGHLGEARILPATAYEEMWAPQGDTNLPSPWEKTIGLGWFLGSQEGHRLVGHGGKDIGFGCGFIMAPDDGMAVIVMVNRDYPAEDFSYKIMDWMLEATPTP